VNPNFFMCVYFFLLSVGRSVSCGSRFGALVGGFGISVPAVLVLETPRSGG
jgi:hypothetical protein